MLQLTIPTRTLSVALILATLIATGACSDKPSWHGTAVVPAIQIPVFSFKDSAGNALTSSSPKGHATLLLFGYTNCPDVCPTTLSDWTRVKKALGTDAQHARFVFVTIDPARDTLNDKDQLLVTYAYGAGWDTMAADVKALLH